MKKLILLFKWIFLYSLFSLIISCANVQQPSNRYSQYTYYSPDRFDKDYAEVMPDHMDTNGKKLIVVDPNVHAWGAYAADGHLVRAGIATAGGSVCPPDADEDDCRTGMGTFKITSIGGEGCYSKKYPRPHGGGLMPYCMYFNNGQALHGSPDNIVVDANISHGCVRMRIPDAEWMSTDFANVGTKVIVRPYES